MKRIHEHSGTDSGWDSDLIEDLAYIKSKLHYRAKASTMLPVFTWSVIILLMMTLVSVTIYNRVSEEQPIPSVNIIIAASTFILFTVNIARYLQSLRFISVHTGKQVLENIQTVDAFLQSQKMLIFRHPDAPEIFQIQSRNLSAGKEDREVIIFIADNNRILINSHFTNRGWGFSPGQRHHRQMAAMLRKYAHNNSLSSTAVRNTF